MALNIKIVSVSHVEISELFTTTDMCINLENRMFFENQQIKKTAKNQIC